MACFQYLLFFALFSPQVLLPSYQSTQTATLAGSAALKKSSIVDDVDINKSTAALFSIFIAGGDSLACFALFFNRTIQQTQKQNQKDHENCWNSMKHFTGCCKTIKKICNFFHIMTRLAFKNYTTWKIHPILMSCPVILTLRWSKYSQWLL